MAKKKRPDSFKKKRSSDLSVRTLEREMPIGEAFLRAYADRIADETSIRIRMNPDRTIDGEMKIFAPEKQTIGEFHDWMLGLETDYWSTVQEVQFEDIISSWWLRLGARFKRKSQKWRTYKLSIFKGGLETTMVHTVRVLDDGADVWATLRAQVANVLNAYQEPGRFGQLRPEYRLVQIIVRIHRGASAPLY